MYHLHFFEGAYRTMDEEISVEEELQRIFEILNDDSRAPEEQLERNYLLVRPYRENMLPKAMLTDLRVPDLASVLPSFREFTARKIDDTHFGVYHDGLQDPFFIGEWVNDKWSVAWNDDVMDMKSLIINLFKLDELQAIAERARAENDRLNGRYSGIYTPYDDEDDNGEFTDEDFERHIRPGMTIIHFLDRWLVQEWANAAIELIYGKFNVGRVSHRGIVGLITKFIEKLGVGNRFKFPNMKQLFNLFDTDDVEVIQSHNYMIVSWDFYINNKTFDDHPDIYTNTIPSPLISTFVHGYRNDLAKTGPVCYFIPFWYGYRVTVRDLTLTNSLDTARRVAAPGKRILNSIASGIFKLVYTQNGMVYITPPADSDFDAYTQPLTRKALAINNTKATNPALMNIYKDILADFRRQSTNSGPVEPVNY